LAYNTNTQSNKSAGIICDVDHRLYEKHYQKLPVITVLNGSLCIIFFSKDNANTRRDLSLEKVKEINNWPRLMIATFLSEAPLPFPIRTSLGLEVRTKSGNAKSLYLKPPSTP
jgi:hypothetical protein